jgi:hypothetical protein
MSNSRNDQVKASVVAPKQSSAPDGKSQLPTGNQDFPVTNGGDSGPTSGPMPK